MRDIYIPQAGDMINAFETGRQTRMASQKDEATRKAGGLMSAGDYKGAAAALYPYDIAAGARVDEMGRAVEANTRRAAYGKRVAAGQGQEAVSDAMAAGDWDAASQIGSYLQNATEQQRAQAKANAERLAGIVAPLGDIPESDMAGRKAYIQANRAELIASGFTDAQIDGFEPTDQNLVPIYVQAIGIKDYLSGKREDKKIELTGAAQEETRRHNKVTETVSAGQLSVSQGNLGMRRQEHDARMKQGGYGAGEDLSGLSTADLMAAAGLTPPK